MTASRDIDEDELHAFVDGQLDSAGCDAVAAALRGDTALADRVAGYAADRDRLRAAYADVAAPALPEGWARRIEAATARRPRPVLTRRYAMAAGLAVAVGGAVAAARRWQQGGGLVDVAQAARDGDERQGVVVPSETFAASGSRDAALQAALHMNVRAPDLRRFGFKLARMTLFGRAAQLRYDDVHGRKLTIYVRPSDGHVQFDLLRRGADRVCVWQDDVVGAVIIAPMAAGEMMRVASAAYAALNL